MKLDPIKLGNDLAAALRGFPGLGITKKAINDEYELYVYSLLIKAAQAQPGAIVTLVDEHGAPTASLVTKTTPRRLTETGFTHYQIKFPHKKPLESHIGIYVRGISREKHECDIALIEEAEAINCRGAFVAVPPVTLDPDVTALVAFFECKCYVATNLTINHGRAFLGLTRDLGGTRTEGYFVSTKPLASVEELLNAHGTYHAHSILATVSNPLKNFEYELNVLFDSFRN